jgi:hypothetical protein
MHAAGGASSASLARSEVACRTKDSVEACRGQAVGQRLLTHEALHSPKHAPLGLRDSLSFGGGALRVAQHSPATSTVSTVDLEAVPSQQSRARAEGVRPAPMMNNFMEDFDAAGLFMSRRLHVTRKQ